MVALVVRILAQRMAAGQPFSSPKPQKKFLAIPIKIWDIDGMG